MEYAANRIRKKRRRIQNRPRGEDEFSKLPDDLISHILSLMPTKYAVRTSILSRRWRYLWTSITNLYFKNLNHHLPVVTFNHFVDRVLALCKSPQIQLFRLRSSCCHGNKVKEWIGKAIRLNASRIVLHRAYELPWGLFTCKTLTALKVHSFPSGIPPSLHLPSLKVLSLHSIVDELLKTLFDGCPMLEDLSLEHITNGTEDIVHIRAPALKKLRFGHTTEYFEIDMDTPNLECLTLWIDSEDTNIPVEMENIQSLVEAGIHLELEEWSNSDRFFRFLARGGSCVRSLSLFFDAPDGMDVYTCFHSSKLPIFHSLTCLILRFTSTCTYKALPYFLVSSPNLKYLSLEVPSLRLGPRRGPALSPLPTWLVASDDYKDFALYSYKDFILAFHSQHCLCLTLFHLEVIKLKGFEESEDDDLAIVEYLLSNAENLKRLKICLKGEVKRWSGLSMLASSRDCKIEYIEEDEDPEFFYVGFSRSEQADASWTAN